MKKAKRTTFIYKLVDPKTKKVRYVGKSNNPKARYEYHLQDQTTNKHKWNWIKKLAKKGLKPELVIIEEVPYKIWGEREKYWIKRYRDEGEPLVNILEGGSSFPSAIVENWVTLMEPFLTEELLDKFKLLSDDEQKNICSKTALAGMGYSWIAIKLRGGDPRVEFSPAKTYLAAKEMAVALLT